MSNLTTEDSISVDLDGQLGNINSRNKFGVEKYPLMNLEEGLVGWDSQNDPSNPRNFKPSQKWFILGLVSSIMFLSPISSLILAPGITFVNEEFNNTSHILGIFAVSIFVMGFCVGPLFLSPLSEIFGRRIVLNISNVIFCAFSLGCALARNLSSLIIMRFLAGVGGSACITIGAGVISDLFIPEERGKAIAIYSLGNLFGPIMGPICGGFIAQRAGWRWDAWIVFIAGCMLTGSILVFNCETNHSVILGWKTARLQKETNCSELQNIMTHTEDADALKRRNVLKRGIVRPLKLLSRSPIVLLLSLYMSFIFGLLFLLFTTITTVYIEKYNWSPELTGLAYIGLGLGFFIGIVFVARTSDATIIRLTEKNNSIYEPEMRLPTCVFFGCLVPISLFWYGWATDQHNHWTIPIVALIPFGIGIVGIFAPVQTYLIDSFPQHAASATAALTFLRCFFGAVLPLVGPSMYGSLGLGWGNSLLGFMAIAMIPFPALIYKYGDTLRKKYPVVL